jgi:hypothetical protein
MASRKEKKAHTPPALLAPVTGGAVAPGAELTLIVELKTKRFRADRYRKRKKNGISCLREGIEVNRTRFARSLVQEMINDGIIKQRHEFTMLSPEKKRAKVQERIQKLVKDYQEAGVTYATDMDDDFFDW